MQKQNKLYLLVPLFFVFLSSGCVVRTYQMTKDRIDQDLNSGNRGYFKGQAPSEEGKERKTTRTTQVVEIEFHSPIKFERMPKERLAEKEPPEKTEDKEIWGNRGYISKSETPEILEPQTTTSTGAQMEKYTVKKGDTLQKISKNIYGTTKKWIKIYNANKDVLKGADKIYPGQVINIPVEELKEPKANLK